MLELPRYLASGVLSHTEELLLTPSFNAAQFRIMQNSIVFQNTLAACHRPNAAMCEQVAMFQLTAKAYRRTSSPMAQQRWCRRSIRPGIVHSSSHSCLRVTVCHVEVARITVGEGWGNVEKDWTIPDTLFHNPRHLRIGSRACPTWFGTRRSTAVRCLGQRQACWQPTRRSSALRAQYLRKS